MGAVHVFGTVGCIGKGLAATFVLADVWAFSSVRTKMGLEILETRIGLVATVIL